MALWQCMGVNYNNKKQGKKRYSKITGQYEKRHSYLKIRIVIEKDRFSFSVRHFGIWINFDTLVCLVIFRLMTELSGWFV